MATRLGRAIYWAWIFGIPLVVHTWFFSEAFLESTLAPATLLFVFAIGGVCSRESRTGVAGLGIDEASDGAAKESLKSETTSGKRRWSPSVLIVGSSGMGWAVTALHQYLGEPALGSNLAGAVWLGLWTVLLVTFWFLSGGTRALDLETRT